MVTTEKQRLIEQAADALQQAKRVIAFTGAGISVESGIPPFRGPDGLWSRYNPQVLDLDYFHAHPLAAWQVIKEIFYDYFGQAQPNAAHIALANLEQAGRLQGIITQNIDNLHQEAGSQDVVEYHGTSRFLTCTSCGQKLAASPQIFEQMPPACPHCGGLLKPDFIFFGEGIPPEAHRRSLAETQLSDVWLVIGTTGEIMPAALLPREAQHRGARIIEVNVQPSRYTFDITEIFLPGRATLTLSALADALLKRSKSD